MKKLLNAIFLRDYKFSYPSSWFGTLVAWFMSFAVCLLLTGFLYMIPYKAFVYYAACAVSLLYIIMGGGFRFNKQMIIFYAVIILNVLILDIDPLFNSKIRAAFFIFVTLVCSPVIVSEKAVAFRERVFKYTFIGMSIMVLLTFFCYFAGINMMPYNREASDFMYENYMEFGGKFSGLFGHSMIMGPVAAIVCLVYLNMYMKDSKKIWMVFFFLAAMSCLFSAARSALLAIAFGVFMLMMANYGKNSKSTRRIFSIIILSCIAVIPIADKAFSGLFNKIEVTQSEFGGYNSREKKFSYRMQEFAEAPLTGVGFASIDTRTGDAYSRLNGQIEPGTAHLAVLAQTGLIGMTAYIILLFGAYKRFRKRQSLKALIALSLFWAFFAHGWAEGWIFAPGGMICFLFWLSLAQCYDLEYKED